jgi:hypothetical protein
MILEVCRDGVWTLSFGLSQFHGHGSWLVCEVARVFVDCWNPEISTSDKHIVDTIALITKCNLKATSHTRLKARDHCNLRAFIG